MRHHPKRRFGLLFVAAAALLVAAFVAPAGAGVGQSFGKHNVFARSFTENSALTEVTLPLYEGVSGSQTVWYVITESTSRSDAAKLGVNYAPRLANAVGTDAVMDVTITSGGLIEFPATVDFTPDRVVVPSGTGFPPTAATPGAVAETVSGISYSPLIRLPDGTVRNAPHIGVGSSFTPGDYDNWGDRVLFASLEDGWVVLIEAEGFYEHRETYYLSFDASDAAAAALERATYAPALGTAPTAGDSGPDSARNGLVAFVNGPTTGETQGLNAALLGLEGPLNVLEFVPEGQSVEYSPLWDVHLAEWTTAAINGGLRSQQTDFDEVFAHADAGHITAPGGGTFGASGFIVNCPAISFDPPED